VRDLAVRARNKQIKPDELSGSTFSISNFGMFNVTTGTPIINQPNVGILGVGTIKKKPVVIEAADSDSIGIRSMMYLSIGFDHRLVDGAGGAQFSQAIQQNLENMDLEHLF
jgi:2-oxoglutarate dehydrogenase E2 component (dihydrolipoamide succinyltransferase)